MKRLALCLLAMAIVPCTAFAQDGVDGEANLNVHVIPADFVAGLCGAYALEGQDCSLNSHAPAAGNAFVYLVASNVNGWAGDGGIGNGIGAAQFGIEYTTLSFLTWNRCTGGLESPQADTNGTWPESGTGNAVTWAVCYDPLGENAMIGVLLAADGSAGTINTTVDPRDGAGLAAYTDCDLFTWEIPGLNGADLGDPNSAPGCSPIVPTVNKSWGAIKAAF